MIIQFVEFSIKPGKEKTVHKIIRSSLEVLHKQGHRGLTYHSYRNTSNKLEFVQLNVFDSEEAKERFENSEELKEQHHRLLTVVDGQIKKNILESFEIYHSKE